MKNLCEVQFSQLFGAPSGPAHLPRQGGRQKAPLNGSDAPISFKGVVSSKGAARFHLDVSLWLQQTSALNAGRRQCFITCSSGVVFTEPLYKGAFSQDALSLITAVSATLSVKAFSCQLLYHQLSQKSRGEQVFPV